MSVTGESTQVKLDRFRQDSSRELHGEVIGCAFVHCERHPIIYSMILLSISLFLFVFLIGCIFYFTDSDINQEDLTDEYEDELIYDPDSNNTKNVEDDELDGKQYEYKNTGD